MTSEFGRRILPAVLVVFAAAALPSRAAPLRAGAAAVDVTPEKLPVLINGGFLSASADKVHDPLFARCLVLDDGTTRLAICVVDSCLMPRDLLDDAKARASKATGIPTGRMLVSATHAHSCPAAMGVLGTDVDPNYPPLLKDRIAKAIEQANANLAPAKVAWGVANAAEYTGCRRWIRRPDRMLRDPFGELTVRANMHPGFQSPDAIGPSGPEDPDLTVLSVRSTEGNRPIALLANFGMHYFATGVTPVSSDYYGLFAQKVAKRLGADQPAAAGQPAFVGIMSQGTSGDMWRVDYGKPQPKITIDEYADALAKRAVEAVAKAEHRADLPLAMGQREIPVKSRGTTAERLEAAKKVVAGMNGRAPKTIPEVYAREQVYLSERPQASMLLQAIRVGDFGIAAMPNEVYALTGLKIKAQSPLRTTMNVELANDELGYIPPPEQHKLGGYTTWRARSSYCDVDAEPKMVEAVLGLLEEVSGKPRRKVTESHGPYVNAVLESGPRAYWRMNEMTGPVAHDLANNSGGHDAAYEDGVVFYLPGPASPAFGGEGVVNRAPHFAGGRMRADLKELGPAWSVELWFWNGLPGDARPVAGYLFSRGPDKAEGAPGDHLGIGGTAVAADRLIFFNGNRLNTVLAGRTKIEPKTWNHVVLVRDGRHATVYLNGNPEPEISGEADPGYPPGVAQVFVGGRNDNFANFEGKIDEVAVYPRALAADEAAQHYKTSGMHPEAAATALKPPAPRSPADSLKALHVKDGFEVELVAAEPLVMDPVAIAFGPDGKLWVAEMSDYPYGGDGKMKPIGRIRYLESTHGDGKYDKSTLFLEGVNFPTGVMPWHKGVIVTAAPEIFYAEDTDGDGKADVRRTLYSGFTQGNPQLRVNDPTWGLDNWVYIANGLSSRGRVRSEKTGAEVEMSGHDARLRPDEGLIEPEAGLTEFGRNRSDWGDYFGCDNSHPMWHFVLPERYGRRNPYVGPPKATNPMGLPPNGPVYQLSPEGKRYHSFEHAGHYTSACSATVYRDELLFSRGTDLEAFVCEPVHNLVQHLVLTESGPTYTASYREDETKHDFLASEDPWCRPVFVTTGPDGALWVVDMYRYMIEHPDWLPQQGRDEYRPFFRLGENRGRIYRIFPKGQHPRTVPRLDKLGTSELVAALDSPGGWQRDAVQQLLVWSGDKSAVGPLEQLAASSRNPLARLHALCTLDGMGALKPEAIERALRDEHPAVRRQAVRLAETRGKDAPQLIDAAIRLADDPDAKVRLQLACTLGEWDGDAAGKALAKLAMSAGDDPWLAEAVMTSAPRHYAALASAALAAPDPLAVGFFRELLDMALARNDRADIAKLLAPVVSAKDGRFRTEQLEAFGGLLNYLGQHRSSLQQLATEKQDALSERLGTSAALFESARKIAADAAAPVEQRTAAVTLLGREPAHAAEDLERLSRLLTPQTPTPVQRAAVGAMARVGADRVPGMLLGGWPSHSPEVRTAVVDAMLGREPWAFALLKEVEAGRIRPSEFDAARRQRLLQHSSGRVKSLAQQLLGATADPSREKVIEAYRPALALAGDATRGAKVFANNCATCHHLGNVGQEIGPNLQSVAGWQPEALLTAILDPNRQVEPRYLGYAATLNDGEVVFGVITAETGGGIRMKGLDGKERTLVRGSIQSLVSTNRSLMPDGLEAQISKQDLADLIRFLQSPQGK